MSFSSKRFRHKNPRRHHLAKRLRLERLEARRVLATFFVTTTDDSLSDDPGSNCLADDQAASIDCSIRSAISAAEDNPGPDTVSIPDGTYLLGSQLGSLDVFDNDDLSLLGNPDAPENVVIDGQQSRVFDLLPDLPIRVSFTGVTIQNGVANDGSGGGGINAGAVDLVVDRSIIQNNRADVGGITFQNPSSGGGIQAAGNVTITNSQLLNNEATLHGGAIDFGPFLEGRSLQISDTTISGNRAAVDGGGIFVSSGDVDSSVSIGRSTVENNEADDSGGGVFVLDTGVTVFESVFRSNSALGANQADGVGGGFYIRTESGNESFDIRDTAFEDNRAAGGGGGAIFENADGTIASTTFQENGVTRLGSGPNLFAQGGGGFVLLGLNRVPSVAANDLTVTDNFAPAGGGIAVIDTDFTLTESTVSGNNAGNAQAGGGGIGAIATVPAAMTIEISDSTINANRSEGEAGGIGAIDVDLTLTSVIVQQNVALGGRAGGVGVLGNERIPAVRIEQSTIQSNQASTDGGGIYAPGPLTIDQTVISGNSVDAGSGGGIYLGTGQGSTGSLLVTDSTISDNNAEGAGGGVNIESPLDLDAEADARFVDTAIVGNVVVLTGGGIRSSGMPVTLTRATVSNNMATGGLLEGDGGAIFMDGDLTIRESSFTGNSADYGGAIDYSGGVLDVADSSFIGNVGDSEGGAIYLLQLDTAIAATWSNVLFEFNESFQGGAVAAVNSSESGLALAFVDTTFEENSAVDGGALLSVGSQLAIQRSTFNENVAGINGGAVLILDGNTAIEDTTFTANNAAELGGAIYASGPLVVTNSTIAENTAGTAGGGVHLDDEFALGGEGNFVDTTIDGNVASTGGGISARAVPVTLTRLIVSNNQAAGVGGGLASEDDVIVRETSFFQNTAGSDGGAAHFDLGNAVIENSTFSGNIAAESGGGIFAIDSFVELVHTTFTLNSAQIGGGLSELNSSVEVGNSVIAANSASSSDPDVSGTFISNDGNFIGDIGNAVGFNGSLDQVGPDVQGPLDPRLGPLLLQSSSDETPTHVPLSGSPLIDAAGSTVSLAIDQRGTIRPIDGDGDSVAIADIGAIEGEGVIATTGNTVQGHLFCDADGNFQEDPGEQVIGATVFVDLNGNQVLDPEEPFAITDANGNYRITDVPPGDWNVITSLPEGCNTVSPKLASRTTLGVGELARSIDTADIDLNGTPDLVVANDLSSDLTLLRNDGDSFSIAQRIPLSERPQSVTVWQPDGELPTYAVAAVGTTESKGKVFLIEPSGMKTIPVGDGPVQVVMDDFNSDGRPDLLISAFRSSDLHLLLGGTDEPTQITTGRNVLGAAVGDFDGDGRPDIVVGGAGFGGDTDSEIKVLLGNGDGTFRKGPSLAVAKNVVQLTGVDLNGDGTDEILALAKSGRLISLRLQENVSGAAELAVISSTALDRGANAFAVGKFNQDDLLDVAVTNLDRESVEILVGAGDGRFVSVNTTTNVPSPSDIVIGDFNGNGFGDVAVSNLFASGSGPDQGPRYQLPSTATILQFDIASETVSLTGDTVATVDFAFPAANPDLLLDVNGDMQVTPADALAVINGLNRTSGAEGEQSRDRFRPDTDVNRDGVTTPLDALLIINHLNRRGPSGEAEAYFPSIEEDPEEARRRRERERALAVDAILTAW